MITEEQIDLLVERLIERINKANVYFLESIGSSIKRIGALTPSKAHQLAQILKYGGNYEEIVNQIARYTNLNIKDIDEIFSAYAKQDYNFYKKFYQYRNIPFVPFNENQALRSQTISLANIVKNEMYDYFRTNVLGYTIRDNKGKVIFKGLKDVYNDLIDEALLNVGQGKETFDNAMSRILKQVGGSGLKTIDYKSGRSVRLDSTIRMHLKSSLRELHNENQKIVGEEFGSDGIEISAHSNPAPDHEKVQGRQFSNEEYAKLQNGEVAKDYKGRVYSLDHDDNDSYRPISEMSCYHYIFSIILGVSQPEYNEEELQKIIDDNEKGFTFENKHYSMYDGEQLLRKIELEIRKSKDTQILGRASDNIEVIEQAQSKITQLTTKYHEILKASGLKSKLERAKVSGYRRVNVAKMK